MVVVNASRKWTRRAHFYAASLFNGFALCTAMLQLPDIAILFFSDEPDSCRLPFSSACNAAQSKAALALSVSNGMKAFVALVLGPTLGALSDVHGRRFFWIGSQCACFLAYMAMLAHVLGYVSLWPFLVLNTLSGLLLPALLSVVADDYTPANRAAAFGLLIATFDVSILAGPLLAGGLSLRIGSVIVVAAGAIALALAVAYGESLAPSERLSPSDGIPYWRPDKALNMVNSTALFRRLAFIVLASTLPLAGSQQVFLLYLKAAFGLPRAAAGGYFALLGTSGLAVQLFVLPFLIRRCPITRVLTLGLGLQMLQNTLLAMARGQPFVVVSCVAGGFGSIVFPCVSALKANAAPATEQGRVQGAISAIQSFAMGMGPLIYGSMFAWFLGPHTPWGKPMPKAVYSTSLLFLLPALLVTVVLHRHIPDEILHPEPLVVRRRVTSRPSDRQI